MRTLALSIARTTVSRARFVLGALATITVAMATRADGRGAPGDGAPSTRITGKTVTVSMLYDGRSMRFEASKLTIVRGDAVQFVNVSGGPHNVEFDRGTVSVQAIAPLSAAMSNQVGDLAGELVAVPNATYTIVFDDVPAGKYRFFCTPHVGMGMTGSITIR